MRKYQCGASPIFCAVGRIAAHIWHRPGTDNEADMISEMFRWVLVVIDVKLAAGCMYDHLQQYSGTECA